MYDITDADMQEAFLGYSEGEFEDVESLRVLKILISRFITLRKMCFCCLLALEADGGREDFMRWKTALEEVKEISALTIQSESRIRSVFEQEECTILPVQRTVTGANLHSISSSINTEDSFDSRP